MKILGLDPGSYACGIGIIEWIDGALRPVAYTVVRQKKSLSEHRRLQPIYDGVRAFVNEHQPETAAVEKVFTAYNPNTAVKLGEARGVAVLALEQAGLIPVAYAATKVKKAVVGYGHAEKHQMQVMIQHLLGLADAPPADAADALAIAICHAASIGYGSSRRRSRTGSATTAGARSSAAPTRKLTAAHIHAMLGEVGGKA